MRGMNDAITTMIVVTVILSAVIGWGVIEFIIWLFSFVHIAIA